MSNDPTELLRKDRIVELNQGEIDRKVLEEKHGHVWTTDEMSAEFSAIGFMAPFIVVSRKADGQKGSLEFTHNPRFYFNWSPDN
jgi:hypothetical protein